MTFVQVENISKRSHEYSFLRDIYKLMRKHKIQRIYRIKLENNKIIDSFQSHDIQSAKYIRQINHLEIYHNTIYKYIIKFKYRSFNNSLKKYFKKYGIIAINTIDINLYDGVYTSNDKICISNVDILFEDDRVLYIDKLYLDMN